MKKLFLLTGAAMLAACGQQATETEDANVVAEAEAPAEAMSLTQTSWQFTQDGKQLFESIDENGNYIVETPEGEHVDHGTYVMKDGKHCFTSAMTDEGEECWTAVKDAEVGETVTVTSDDGETLEVTRAEYRALEMPS